jgi:hypothetical protein
MGSANGARQTAIASDTVISCDGRLVLECVIRHGRVAGDVYHSVAQVSSRLFLFVTDQLARPLVAHVCHMESGVITKSIRRLSDGRKHGVCHSQTIIWGVQSLISTRTDMRVVYDAGVAMSSTKTFRVWCDGEYMWRKWKNRIVIDNRPGTVSVVASGPPSNLHLPLCDLYECVECVEHAHPIDIDEIIVSIRNEDDFTRLRFRAADAFRTYFRSNRKLDWLGGTGAAIDELPRDIALLVVRYLPGECRSAILGGSRAVAPHASQKCTLL